MKSKIKETAAAVVAGVVGVGLLASPFLLQANDEEDDNAPSVSLIKVQNHGSIGFDVEFDVSVPWPHIDSSYDSFRLNHDGEQVDEDVPRSATLESEAPNQGWMEIPGYDGIGIPLPYPGYVHSFEYKIKALKAVDFTFFPFAGPPVGGGFRGGFWLVEYETHTVDISLYVVLNSKGTLYSMNAWASDSDGNGYEVPVYYSAGGRNFGPFEE